jgi:hypothetical protein
MMISQNNTAFKWRSGLRLSFAPLLVAVGFTSGVLAEMTAHAQDTQPFDLLSIPKTDTITIDGGTTNDQVSMDQVLDNVLGVSATDDVNASTGTSQIDASVFGESNAVVVAAPPLTASPGSVTEDAPAEDGASQALPETSAESGVNAYSTNKIDRRSISDVGLAAIGVGDVDNTNEDLDSLIWRGTSARDAVFLLENAAVDSRSQAVTRLAYKVVARQSVPPTGANILSADLVAARLAFLANGGRSSDLAALAEQLPDGDKWHDWKRWLVEHHLMLRNDVAACGVVNQQITQTMDPFWHKANVICQAVQGKVDAARFAADILAANDIEDPIFYGLVNEVLSGASAQQIDPTKLESMHIVLMDVANRPIPLEGLSVLPKQMAETVVKLKFLGPEARMVSTFNGLNRGLITSRQAGKLWRNASAETTDPAEALARLHSNGDVLTTALAWRALAQDGSGQRLEWIVDAVKAEIMAGRGPIMLPLYAELVREAMTDESVASSMKFDDLGLAPKLAMLLAIANPEDVSTLEAFGGNNSALMAAQLLRSMFGEPLSGKVIESLGLWHMLPVLAATGVLVEDQNWLELTKTTRVAGRSAMTLSPVLLQAVKSASENSRVAETVLLTNWLLKDVMLSQITPADVAVVINALEAIGQERTAKNLAREILAEHLMQGLVAMIPNGIKS